MAKYVIFREDNESEFESWNFAINYELNSKHLEKLRNIVIDYHNYVLSEDLFLYDELLRFKKLLPPTNYLSSLTIIDKEILENILDDLTHMNEEDQYEFFNEGGIRKLFPS